MFINFFYLLRNYGVPVSINEWMTLTEALCRGLAFSSLYGFYTLARSVLVKSETHFDRYDLAFQHYFYGIETPQELTERVMKWLEHALHRCAYRLKNANNFKNGISTSCGGNWKRG